MRKAFALILTTFLVGACTSGSTEADTKPASSDPDLEVVPWEVATDHAQEDPALGGETEVPLERRLVILAPQGVEPCRATSREISGAVRIEMRCRARDPSPECEGNGEACAVPIARATTTLAAPLDGRPVVDAHDGERRAACTWPKWIPQWRPETVGYRVDGCRYSDWLRGILITRAYELREGRHARTRVPRSRLENGGDLLVGDHGRLTDADSGDRIDKEAWVVGATDSEVVVQLRNAGARELTVALRDTDRTFLLDNERTAASRARY